MTSTRVSLLAAAILVMNGLGIFLADEACAGGCFDTGYCISPCSAQTEQVKKTMCEQLCINNPHPSGHKCWYQSHSCLPESQSGTYCPDGWNRVQCKCKAGTGN